MRELCVIICVAVLAATPAVAATPVGCDHFKWSLDHEKELLAKSAAIASGDAASIATGENLALTPQNGAKLPHKPSRSPRFPNSYAGYVTFVAPSKAGLYRVTVTHGAWVDVVQDGHLLKPSDHTGAKGCEGLAKSMKFNLAATPFAIEISSSTAPSVALVVTPD